MGVGRGGRAKCPASSVKWLHFKNPSIFTKCGLTSKESAHSQRRPQTNPSLPPISSPHPHPTPTLSHPPPPFPPPPPPESLPILSPLHHLDLGWKPRASRRPLPGSQGQGGGSLLSTVNVTTVVKPTQSQLLVAAKLNSVLVENVPPRTKLLFHRR